MHKKSTENIQGIFLFKKHKRRFFLRATNKIVYLAFSEIKIKNSLLHYINGKMIKQFNRNRICLILFVIISYPLQIFVTQEHYEVLFSSYPFSPITYHCAAFKMFYTAS